LPVIENLDILGNVLDSLSSGCIPTMVDLCDRLKNMDTNV